MIKILIAIGFLVNFAAYGNLFSTLIYAVIWGISNLTIRFYFKGKDKNTAKEISILFISLMYFLSAIIELLITQGIDTVGSDAAYFFRTATDPQWNFRSYFFDPFNSGLTSDYVIGFKEDFVPILIWNKIYNLFYSIGIPKGRYIGTSINTLFLVWTSFIGLNILRSMEFMNNKIPEKFYKLLFCANGILWMYGSIHLRESVITFIISILLKVWIDWIHKSSFFNLIKLGIVNTSFYFIGDFLRGGYQNIIYIFIISFLILEFYKIIIEKRIRLRHFILLSLIIVILLIKFENFSEVFLGIQGRFQQYNYLSSKEASVDSIGMILVNQPIYIRILLSGFFLLIMPIPFWSGQEEYFSIYQLFKSTFAIYNYFTIPFLIIFIRDNIRNFKKINLDKLFLISLLIQIITFIGITSVDSRHFGNFAIIYIILICCINLNSRRIRDEYIYLLGYLFLSIFLLYLAYSVYKFQSIYISLIFILIPLFISIFLLKEKNNLR